MKSGSQPLQETKGLRIKFAGHKRKKAIKETDRKREEKDTRLSVGVALCDLHYANCAAKVRLIFETCKKKREINGERSVRGR